MIISTDFESKSNILTMKIWLHQYCFIFYRNIACENCPSDEGLKVDRSEPRNSCIKNLMTSFPANCRFQNNTNRKGKNRKGGHITYVQNCIKDTINKGYSDTR
jgi:hypothetical protein